MEIDRRALLAYGALLPLLGSGSRPARAAEQAAREKADYTLRIATGVCTENLIRVDDVMESPKLAE